MSVNFFVHPNIKDVPVGRKMEALGREKQNYVHTQVREKERERERVRETKKRALLKKARKERS